MAVDYFTKWIEAEALASTTSKRVKTFYWKKLICIFGVPIAIVSDNGQQFFSKYTREFCESQGIQMRLASMEHPQSNGQAESGNKEVLAGIKKRLEEAKGKWPDEFPAVIWSYNTTAQTSTCETPYKLTYGTDAM